MKIFFTRSVLILFLMNLGACASTISANLEEAQFALDAGEYDDAITAGEAVLAVDTGNFVAARIVQSAYFSRSNLDFLDLASTIIDLQNSSSTNFAEVAGVIPSDLIEADLRSSIETAEALEGIDDTTIADATLAAIAFDLGLAQIIEHFSIGVMGSDYFDGGSDADTVDPSGITEEDKDVVQANLVSFDNRLIASGLDSTEDFLADVRQTYCILEPISSGSGFTLGEYQAFVSCQLSNDPDLVDTTEFTADVADCSEFDPDTQAAEVTACYAVDTEL